MRSTLTRRNSCHIVCNARYTQKTETLLVNSECTCLRQIAKFSWLYLVEVICYNSKVLLYSKTCLSSEYQAFPYIGGLARGFNGGYNLTALPAIEHFYFELRIK